MLSYCEVVCIVNICTLSGSSNRQERESFSLTYLLRSLSPTMIDGRFKLRPDKYRLHWEYDLKQALKKWSPAYV